MTWVLGTGCLFGYGALISDVRVTWADGRHADILQKVYPVSRNLVAGFAGSVAFGFQTIEDLQRFCRSDDRNTMWLPKRTAWEWRRRARYAFSRAPDWIRRSGAEVILAGASAEMNGPFPWAHCVKMVAPDFLPQVVPPLQWDSIGSGTVSVLARRYLVNAWGQHFDLFKAETMNPGGYVRTVAFNLMASLKAQPLEGVSDVVQVALGTANGCVLQGLTSTAHHPDGTQERHATPADLCTSWQAFLDRCGASSADAFGASAGLPRQWQRSHTDPAGLYTCQNGAGDQ